MAQVELPKDKKRGLWLPLTVITRWAHYKHKRDKFGNIIETKLVAEGFHELDLVPNSALNWISSQIAGITSGKAAVLALGTGTTARVMGMTQLVGEITGTGLTRATGTTSGIGALVNLAGSGSASQGTGSYAVGNTFTASGSVTVNEGALGQDVIFNAGIITTDLLSPAPALAAGDTLRWQIELVL